MSVIKSFETYDGDDVQDTFEIPFNYRSKSEVTVTRDGENEEGFTFTDPSHILLTSPLLTGEVLVIQRVTDLSEPAVKFRNSSGWTGGQLNAMVDQLLFSVQEARDTADRGLFIDLTGGYNFEGRSARNLAEPALDGDAVTKLWAETSMTSTLGQAIAAKDSAENSESNVTTLHGEVQGWNSNVNLKHSDVQGWHTDVQGWNSNVNLKHSDVQGWHFDVDGWHTDVQVWQAEVSTNTTLTLGYRNEAEGFRNEAEQFKNEAETAAGPGFPSGGIIMWSGSAASIPDGWFLCDGTNGTPDLRDRFIVGAGAAYNPGDTGGEGWVTLTEAQMPSHSHTGSAASAGNHTHDYRSDLNSAQGSGYRVHKSGTSPNGPYTANSAIAAGGAHSHSLTINSTGSGAAHENRPPYYALCLIMKG